MTWTPLRPREIARAGVARGYSAAAVRESVEAVVEAQAKAAAVSPPRPTAMEWTDLDGGRSISDTGRFLVTRTDSGYVLRDGNRRHDFIFPSRQHAKVYARYRETKEALGEPGAASP